MVYLRLFSLFFIILLIAFGTVGGCGGDDDNIFGQNGEIKCEKALENGDAFCSTIFTNPGMCCEEKCGLFGDCSQSCPAEFRPCCPGDLKLCSFVDLCVDNLDQCPDSNQPLVSNLLTVRLQELNCEKFFAITIYLTGNVSGPTGTEVTITSHQIPQFNQSPDCQSWNKVEGRCIRTEGDPVATSWRTFIYLFDYFQRPTPEVKFLITTQDDIVTFTQRPCDCIFGIECLN